MTGDSPLQAGPGRLHLDIFDQDQVWVDVRGIQHALHEMTSEYRANVIGHLLEHASDYHAAVRSRANFDRAVARQRGVPPPDTRPIPNDPREWIDATPLMRQLRATTPKWEEHATDELDALNDDGHGRWRVNTESSAYVLDLDTRTSTRRPGENDDSVDLRQDGKTVPLIRLVSCERGASAVLILDVRGDGIPTMRTTTPVWRITRAGADS